MEIRAKLRREQFGTFLQITVDHLGEVHTRMEPIRESALAFESYFELMMEAITHDLKKVFLEEASKARTEKE